MPNKLQPALELKLLANSSSETSVHSLIYNIRWRSYDIDKSSQDSTDGSARMVIAIEIFNPFSVNEGSRSLRRLETLLKANLFDCFKFLKIIIL